MFEIRLRGVMLFETRTEEGRTYLNRILLPHAESDDDVAKHWKHPKKKAIKHFAGAVREQGNIRQRGKLRSQPISFGSGEELPLVQKGLRDKLPDIRRVLDNVRIRPNGFVEVVPRGKATLILADHKNDVAFTFLDRKFTYFSATLKYDDGPPAHNITGIDSLQAGDGFALYSFENDNASIADLDEVHRHASCKNVPADDDFYWLYGMFEMNDGTPLDVAKLNPPVPTPDCSDTLAMRKKGYVVSVSTCFPGFW